MGTQLISILENSKNFEPKKKNTREVVIFVSVFLHLLNNSSKRDIFLILRYFAGDNI